MVGGLGYAQSSSCKAIKGKILPPPPAFFVGGEVVDFGYPVFREFFFIRVEDPVAEVSESSSITTPTFGWMLDALLEDFCAEI